MLVTFDCIWRPWNWVSTSKSTFGSPRKQSDQWVYGLRVNWSLARPDTCLTVNHYSFVLHTSDGVGSAHITRILHLYTFDWKKPFFAQHHIGIDRYLKIAAIEHVQQQVDTLQMAFGGMQFGIMNTNVSDLRKMTAKIQVSYLCVWKRFSWKWKSATKIFLKQTTSLSKNFPVVVFDINSSSSIESFR